ncbi:MAG: hypothetical protein GXP03_09295 [Alphaproteobacteria bacterium]|nr:hypothetical protein [Alphaproteobacteria bacterium]
MGKHNLLKTTMAALLAVTLPVAVGAQTQPQDCAVCGQLARYTISVPAEIAAGVWARIGQKPLALARLNGGQVCAAPSLSGGLAALNGQADAEFARAERLAIRVGECGASRSLKLAPAEYCAATSAMMVRQATLKRASTSFGIAASLYAAALAQSQVVEQRLAADIALFSGGALDDLRRAIEGLASDDPAAVDVPSWQLNGRDLLELGHSLSDLVASGSADQGSAELAAVLVAAGQALPRLGEDIDQALTRAAVMQPSTARALQKRALDLVADILWARESARQSGEARQSEIEAMLNTDANAVPISAVAGDYLQAVQCLEQAAISAAVAAEGAAMGLDMIDEFGPKPACDTAVSRPMSLADILAAEPKSDKLNATLARGMCPAE